MGGPQSKEEEEGEKHLLCPAWYVRGRGRRRRRRRRGKRRKGLLTFEVHSRRTEEEGGPMQSHTLDGRGKAAVVHYGTTRKENAFFPGGKEEKKKGEKFVIHVSLYLPTYLPRAVSYYYHNSYYYYNYTNGQPYNNTTKAHAPVQHICVEATGYYC